MKSTYKKILIACLVLGLGMLVYDYFSLRVSFDGMLKRNEAGRGPLTDELELHFKGNDRDYEIEIAEKGLSKKQQKKLFAQAIKELESSYLGKNKTPDKVIYDLNLQKSYCDGMILAEYKFDKYGIISDDGRLQYENIPEEGEVVGIVAELMYEDVSELYCFNVVVMQPGLDTITGQLKAIDKAVEKADKATRTKDYITLPNTAGNMQLKWKKKMNYRGLQVMFLGMVAVAGLMLGKKRDEKLVEKKRLEEKERDYPRIVSELSILMGAGMSFRNALERITSKYNATKNSGQIRPGYEEMALTYRKIVDGMGEIAALEDLGMKSESKEYRKLAMLLSQNLKKGSKDLLDSLEKEERYSFEMRKQRVIREGEEASTKLLLPMAGMLFIVITILVVPAMMQMNI